MVASYREGGVAKVNENFIRLTPDRQSKRGHLWSSRRVDVHDWSVVLEFRVSGQGKTLFGDGLAFWFTDMPNIRNGEVFGVVDDFKGFAVVFDTFRNQEFLAVHKDISVLTGDGKPGAGDRRNTERPGCDADFRCVYCCWWLVVGGVCFLIPFPSSRHVFVLYFPSSSHSFLFFFFFSSFSVSCVPFLHPFFSLSHSLSLSSSSSFFFLLLPSSSSSFQTPVVLLRDAVAAIWEDPTVWDDLTRKPPALQRDLSVVVTELKGGEYSKGGEYYCGLMAGVALAEQHALNILKDRPHDEHGLGLNDIAAIHLYTQSKRDGTHCRLFAYMNAALNNGKRRHIRPYFKWVDLDEFDFVLRIF